MAQDRVVVERTVHIAATTDRVGAILTKPEHIPIGRWVRILYLSRETLGSGSARRADGARTWACKRYLTGPPVCQGLSTARTNLALPLATRLPFRASPTILTQPGRVPNLAPRER